MKPVGLWRICKMMVKDGFEVDLSDFGAYHKPSRGFGKTRVGPRPRLFKEGELPKRLLPKRNDDFWLLAD